MRVHIVQEVFQGIASDPEVFRKSAHADKHYLACVNANFKKKFKTITQAIRYMAKLHNDTVGDIDVLGWSVDTK